MKMPKAFVLITSHFGKEKDVLEILKKINAIKIYKVDGTYDFVVEVNAEDMDKLKDIIKWQIGRISGISSPTDPLLVLKN
jgi:DNA-binding Lrp family transcriptional regulator